MKGIIYYVDTSGKGKNKDKILNSSFDKKNKGRLALSCQKDYYISAQLKILYWWCSSDYQARWKEIEENMTGAVPI